MQTLDEEGRQAYTELQQQVPQLQQNLQQMGQAGEEQAEQMQSQIEQELEQMSQNWEKISDQMEMEEQPAGGGPLEDPQEGMEGQEQQNY